MESGDWRADLLKENECYLTDEQKRIIRLMQDGKSQVQIQKMEGLTPGKLRAIFKGIERTLENPPPEAEKNTIKRCRLCGIEKPLTEFGKDKSRSDGHTSMCKTCRNKQNREKKKAA